MAVRVPPLYLWYNLCSNYRNGGGKINKNRAMDVEGQDHRYTEKEAVVNLILGVMK